VDEARGVQCLERVGKRDGERDRLARAERAAGGPQGGEGRPWHVVHEQRSRTGADGDHVPDAGEVLVLDVAESVEARTVPWVSGKVDDADDDALRRPVERDRRPRRSLRTAPDRAENAITALEQCGHDVGGCCGRFHGDIEPWIDALPSVIHRPSAFSRATGV
jgi:hypothetical protein